MEFIDLNRIARTETAGHSSKGNQLKWHSGGYWYKADYMGYEALAEVVISSLLQLSDVTGFVVYEPVRIGYGGTVYNGCRSRNFLGRDESLITVDRLIRQFTGRSVAVEMARMESVKERILYLTENVAEITGIRDFGAYLTAGLEIDALFLNEDRHTNNIAVLYSDEAGTYRLCPYFDHGLSLFSDTKTDFPLDLPFFDCWDRIRAKPFSKNFDEQLDAAEELYGRQICFRFEEADVRRALEPLRELYDAEIIRRAEHVIYQQVRRYRHLWVEKR